jgi:hypothetical protein
VPVIKLLSGTAKTCACPGCATPLVFAGEAGRVTGGVPKAFPRRGDHRR